MLGARSHMDPTGNKRLRGRMGAGGGDGGGGGWAQPSGPKTQVGGAAGLHDLRRRRLGGTGGSPSGRWRRDGLDGAGAGLSATVAGAPPSGAPLTRPSRGRRCWEPPSIFARIMQLGSLAPSLAAWRRASRFHPRPSCSGLNFSRFALAIPTPAGAGLGTAKLPRPMSVLWGGLGGGMDGGEIHTTPYPCLPCLSTAQSRPIIPIELHNCGPPYGGVRQRAGIMFLFNLGSLSTSSLWSPLSSVHQQHHLQPRLSPVLVHHTYH